MMATNPLFQDLYFSSPQEQAQSTPTKDTAHLRRGGYDCEFVERPAGGVVLADRISATCPVCSLVLREPHQATCCGSILCQSCIQDVRNVCPTCKGEFSAFADESVKRSLYALAISCSERGAGCEWVGKLGELDEHLNLQPLPEKLLIGCQFAQIECNHCMQPFQRRYVQAHQSDNCPKRPYTCQHCNKYVASFDDVMQNHWPVCPLFPLFCPNNCEKVLHRQELEHHVSRDCPLTLVECNFRRVGCQVKLPRKDIQSHFRDNAIEHMRLQQKVLVQLQTVVTQCLDENEQLREALNTRERKVQCTLTKHQQKLEEVMCTGTLPFSFVMNDFEQHKRASDCWYSPPFYTHTHGYRVCIKIYANGIGSGNKIHVSVYGFLMRGDFDDDLHWPFQGSITIQLLNQLENRNHHTYTINFARTADRTRINRVTSGEKAGNGVGAHTFIAHTQLGLNTRQNCQYLANNQLKFTVVKATNLDPVTTATRRCQKLESFATAIESRVSVVPIEFTLSGFEERRKQKAVWYSPAFFTRRRGYRMCLKVYPNGWADGEGTHVSIFICMMQGPFDSGLKWPFRGNVTFQITNQIGNSDHFRMTIPLNDETFGRSIDRLTDRKISAGLGCTQVLTHSSLAPKYLFGDCIRIRISRVKSV